MAYSYVEKSHPFTLSPATLDRYLARGWYRMGSNIFTTHFLCFNQQMYSAIWLRLDLKDFNFSKSQRKLMRRNAKLFKHEVGYRQFDAERDLLYARYAENFNGRLSASIRDNLEDYDRESIYNTYEVSIREIANNKLVAASYFDLGKQAVSSILGIYEPSMKAHSLGYYTMLLEIQYCLDNNFRYYYPGYVVPKYERFDYKLRIGDCEYFDVSSGGWLPWSTFEVEKGPVEQQQHALSDLRSSIVENGGACELCIYPLFEARLYHLWEAEYLTYPFVLVLKGKADHEKIWVAIVYDPKDRMYQLLTLHNLEEMRYIFNGQYLDSFPDEGFVKALLQPINVIFTTSNADEMAAMIKNLQI